MGSFQRGKFLFYEERSDLWRQIEKDSDRTRRDLNFFQKPSTTRFDPTHICLSEKASVVKESLNKDNFLTHRDILFRILFIYGMTNKGIGYVQGMNELVAVIYHCFYEFGDEDDIQNAEADTFWCFFIFISPVKKNTFFPDFKDLGKVLLR